MGDRYGLRPYLELIDDFLAGRATASEFEQRYLRRFQDDMAHRPARVFEILDRLFADVDSYVADPDLREQGDLDDDGLYERAAAAQKDLQRYSS